LPRGNCDEPIRLDPKIFNEPFLKYFPSVHQN
jgi:hypothetical protein